MVRTSATDLAISGLTKTFGESVAVDGVTLRIAAGELVALLGPSGCGKTTTLRMIAGLVPPTAGEVLIGGSRVTHMPVHKRNIGMLFQSYALFPHLTVAQNVSFGLQMRRMRKSDIRSKVETALSMVQLKQHADRLPAALSGGQQQRVALARALVIEPSLLLLDEPLGALDKNLRESMQFELRQIQQRLGITAVLVTHDQEEALTMADRVVIMKGGRLEQVGTPREVYECPNSRFVASFIGASNFLRGSAVSSGPTGTRIRLACGADAHVPGGAAASGDLLLSVRPESINLRTSSRNEMPGVNEVSATIEQVLFRGQITHVHMKMSDGTLLLSNQSSLSNSALLPSLSSGAEVIASWPAESGRIVLDS
jgi:putative spermidine/putrescine transport system ATP-binding protein